MFATYSDRVVHTGPLGSAQAAKLINNSLITAITSLVFDAFDLGSALDVDRDRLGEVLANGSAANPSVNIYLGLGADRFSVAAWPTLHKDVARRNRSASIRTSYWARPRPLSPR
jgi:3-hydroxyisobutyrate dehydrogenase-like beta-hydroxyacid dehydrogenase